MSVMSALSRKAAQFWRDESGITTIEFVIVFPVFVAFFLMTVESGIISVRHVMLERSVDLTVRDLRLGALRDPTLDELRANICAIAAVIPNCQDRVEIELVMVEPTNQSDWDNYEPRAQCRDLGDLASSSAVVEEQNNNQLMLIRVCARINPFIPTSVLGKTIIRENNSSEAQGNYSLVSMAAFVVEPFKSEGEGAPGV
ncbi:MAG: TadE/TadG family type IV pilus assembly protein [Yoonia sp.]|uniref:TadE/TadG family type IV pilus assembly protein n=1 Tax=Yoonia sp. TaxID=2212373 RepID=UPI003EFB2A08